MAAKVKVEEEANEKRAPLALPLRGEESESRQMNDEATRKSVSQSLADGRITRGKMWGRRALKCSISQSNFSC